MPDESCASFAIKAIVIFVGIVAQSAAGVPVGHEHNFEPGVRLKAIFKGVVGRIHDKRGIVRPQWEKQRVTLDKAGVETQFDPRLIPGAPIVIFRSVKGIESLSHVAGELSGNQARLFPIARAHRFGEFCAINADLPGKQPAALQLGPAEFGHGRLIFSRQSAEGILAVAIEIEDLIVAL